MAKTTTLDSKELEFLRAELEAQLLNRKPYFDAIKPNAYLPNYEDLQKDMIVQLPDQVASLSRGRLRKLFYYTNPDACEEEQLKEATFGTDFLDACYRYISGGALDRLSYLEKKLDKPKPNSINTTSFPFTKKQYVQQITKTSLLLGFILILSIMSFKEISGYWNASKSEFLAILPIIFAFQVVFSTFSGWLIARWAFHFKKQHQYSFWRVKYITLIFLIFIFFSGIRQLATRGALISEGVVSRNGNIFGTPDFEMIATVGAWVTLLLYLVQILSKYDRFTFKQAVEFSFRGSLIGGIFFSLTYVIYFLLLATQVLHHKDVFISKHIFHVNFPHPERIQLLIPFAALYCFLVLYNVRNTKWKFSQDFSTSGELEKQPLDKKSISTLHTLDLQKGYQLRKFLFVGLSLFLLIVFTFFLRSHLLIGQNFKTRFTHSNLLLFETSGWYLFPEYKNPDLWGNKKYSNNGYLTLETHLGDSWLSNRDYEPKILNILARNIYCGECCRIRLKIVDFNPYQYFQQAGFFLYYSKDEAVPSLRYAFANAGDINEVIAVERKGKYANRHLLKDGDVNNRAFISEVKEQKVLSPIDSIVLECVIEKEHYFFSYKKNEGDFITVDSKLLPLGKPITIGLAAFQGRPDVPSPVREIADVIPAKFEYLEMVTIDCK